MKSTISFLHTIYALFLRDMKQWLSNAVAEGIDATVLAFFELLLYGFMLPAMGMNPAKAISYYIGAMVWLGFLSQYAYAVEIMTSMVDAKRIQFDSLLPTPWSILLLRFIASIAIPSTLLVIPILWAGLLYFGVSLTIREHIALAAFILCAQITLATFFVRLGFTSDHEWMFTNAWPRLLAPMTCLGCLFFGFNDILSVYPRGAYLLLINPLVSIAEGIRALTHQPNALSLYHCLFCLAVQVCWFYYWAYTSIRKQLDMVT